MKAVAAAPNTVELTDSVGPGPLARRGAGELAFFLDVDGTLLEFAEAPDRVRVGPAVPRLLAELKRVTGGAVAFVSGRPLPDLDRLFPGLDLPAAGQHGAEIRGAPPAAPDPVADDAWQNLRAAARLAQHRHPRLLFEDKGRSIAIHYRRAPALAPIARWLALHLAGRSGGRFVVQRGHYVEELRAAGVDKGEAIRHLLGTPPFAGRTPVFVGDDLTDEDAFRLVNRLGGISVKVGAGPTVAPWRLRDPAAVIAWLFRVLEGFGGKLEP